MKILLVSLAASLLIGCNSASPVQVNSNSRDSQPKTEKRETVIAHTTENQTPPDLAPAANSGQKTKWSQGGDAIDTKEFDAAIAKAQMDLRAKPTNGELIAALASAYFKRAVALTEARQYASALGDYRRAVKLDPTNSEAKDWIEKIIMIYDSMNKDYPKEGEEPPPLPFTKGK